VSADTVVPVLTASQPFADTYGYVGLRDWTTGAVHATPAPHAVTGGTINVVSTYGADNTGTTDARAAIQSAIDAANPGDEVYMPNGTYLINSLHPSSGLASSRSGTVYQLRMKTGVNLRGESQAGTILISNLSFNAPNYAAGQNINPNQHCIYVIGSNNLMLSQFTVSSPWNGTYPTDPSINNSLASGPANTIYISGSSSGTWSYNIWLQNVTVEKFVRMGIRINGGCHDVIVKSCTAHKAQDVGPNGAGYGIEIQGNGHTDATGTAPFTDNHTNPYLNTIEDSYWNVIDSCTITGNTASSGAANGAMRHGALIQYWAHNNLVTNCTISGTIYDSIDLHGEDEYNNEIAYNTISGTSAGAAIAAGNSGGGSGTPPVDGHDKTGVNNWIYHNTLTNCQRGITIQYGTPCTVIEDNIISGNTDKNNGYGIMLEFAINTLVRNNTITGNTAVGYIGLYYKSDTSSTAVQPAYWGAPINSRIIGNTIQNNTIGVQVAGIGSGASYSANSISGNGSGNSTP
jgi:parallel beta-helix repeat protein